MKLDESSPVNGAALDIERPHTDNVTMGYMWSFFGAYMSRARQDDLGGLARRRQPSPDHMATGANDTTL
jgi:hypothetical protein